MTHHTHKTHGAARSYFSLLARSGCFQPGKCRCSLHPTVFKNGNSGAWGTVEAISSPNERIWDRKDPGLDVSGPRSWGITDGADWCLAICSSCPTAHDALLICFYFLISNMCSHVHCLLLL